MLTRFLSLATGIVILDVYLQSQLSSNDPLFFFTSNNLAVNAGLIVLAALMVTVSFKKRFDSWYSYICVTYLAVALGILGILGALFSNFFYWFSSDLLPLDYLFILEAAVILGICALSYQHAPKPAKIKRIELSYVSPKLGFLVPKIPNSPSGLGHSFNHTTRRPA